MENNSIITFIITDREENGFVRTIYKANHIMQYGNGVVIHEPEYLMSILNHVKDSFQFRILVHLAYKDEKNAEGIMHINTLKDYFNTDEFVLISREPDLFPKDEEYIYWKNNKVFNTNHINKEKFIDSLHIFTKGGNSANEVVAKITTHTQDVEIDFTILTALPKEEYGIFKKHLNGKKMNGSFVGKFKALEKHHYGKNVSLVSQKKMGMVDASVKISEIISDINSEMIILSGVCGGRKKQKVKLYDLIIPEQIIDIITGKYENEKFTPYNYTEKINEDLIEYLKETVITDDFIKKEMYSLVPNDPKYKRENEIIQNITIHLDTMACGPFVLKTNDFLENKSKEINDKIVGFEMESYGVIRALELSRSNTYGLVVKSVMDYTDSKKGDIKTTDNVNIEEKDVDNIPAGENIKEMAAYISYVCTRALLPHLEKFLIDNRK